MSSLTPRYPLLREHVAIHLSHEDSSVLPFTPGDNPRSAFDRLLASRELAGYLALCDGRRSHDEITAELFADAAGSLLGATLAENLLVSAVKQEWVTIHDQPRTVARDIVVTGSP